MRKILLVDDDRNIKALIEIALKEQGFEILTATKYLEIEKILSNEEIALVLLDLNLPEMPGSEILCLTLNKFPGLKIIIVSASHSLEQAVALMKAGAKDYLAKPFTQKQVVEKVSEVLSLQDENKKN